MSVNTPKRPKTAYYPGLCSFSQPENMRILDPSADPSLAPYWPTMHTAGDYLTAPPPHHPAPMTHSVSSPSSSCGSPEIHPNVVMRTPSTRDSRDHHRDDIQFPTPTTSGSASALHDGFISNSGGREHKRGRPRSESLSNLMIEGSTSPSAIKCKFCNRVFPREKSLAAHLRTHTGERPYVCDYPGCTKSFTQSGQMKTHQRLHTGERPFICAVPACEMRFTHANRHCPVHVNAVLKRDDKFVVKMTPEQNEEVLQWLEKYRAEREDKSTPTRKTPQRSRTTPGSAGKGQSSSGGGGGALPSVSYHKENQPHTPIQDRSMGGESSSSSKCGGGDEELISSSTQSLKRHPQNDENECPVTPTTPSKNPYKSRKGLMVELDMNAGLAMSPLAPLKMKPQPKLIQWQEPLSQGEEEDEDDEDAENGQRIGNYYVHENHHQQVVQTQQRQQQPQNRLKERENRIYSPSKGSPSKRATMKHHGSSSSTFNPKKKWLREACMEDLAKPLEMGNGACGEASVLGSPQKLQIKSMNLLRPTVLMLASKDKQIPLNGGGPSIPPASPRDTIENNRRWLGKMALMQLAAESGHEKTATTTRDGGVSSSSSTSGSQIMPQLPPNGIQGLPQNGAFNDFPEYTQL